MFQTSLINLLCYPHLLSMSFVMNVADIYHRHVMILVLRELDHLFLPYLVILIHVQSI
jgi:predicted nucleotide-binding protein (sugar kinase/HSP70/actin superfamily)